MKNDNAGPGEVWVYGWSDKVKKAIDSRINPAVTDKASLARALGDNRSWITQLLDRDKEQFPKDQDEKVRLDESNKRRLLRRETVVKICDVFGLPLTYFTNKDYTLKEIERLIHRSPWQGLLELGKEDADSDFTLVRKRGLKPPKPTALVGPGRRPKLKGGRNIPELGSFSRGEEAAVEFYGWKDWHVMLFQSRPDGRVISLLPNEWGTPSTLDPQGALSLPPIDQSMWEFDHTEPLGLHTFVAVFHEQPWVGQEVTPEWFCKQLSPESDGSDADRREAVLNKLVVWLENQRKAGLMPAPFEVVVKRLEITPPHAA